MTCDAVKLSCVVPTELPELIAPLILPLAEPFVLTVRWDTAAGRDDAEGPST